MRAVLPLVFASGAASLAVEVVWARKLDRLLGSSSLSGAIVLGSLLGGMGLGAWIAERRLAGRGSPLAVFAALEGLASLSTLAGSWLLGELPGLFRGAGGEVFAALLLAAAGLPLGAGFPVLLGLLDPRRDASRGVRLLYGVNAAGGGLGALAAGLAAVPFWGEDPALLAAAGLQAAVALGAFARAGTRASRAAARSIPVSFRFDAAAAFAFLSGFAVFFWELVWMRVLVLTVGSSVYAFATVAASVVLGIGAGSLAFGGAFLAGAGIWILPLLTLAAACGGYFAVPLLPDAYIAAVRALGVAPLACGAAGAGLVAFLPNFLLGALFPWTVSRRVELAGSFCAVNSAGSILGALAGGPLLAGALYLEGAYRLGLAVLALLFVVALVLERPRGGRSGTLRLWVGASLPLAFLGVFAAGAVAPDSTLGRRRWDYRALLSGVYQWSLEALRENSLEESYRSRELLLVMEGREAIVSVELDRDANTVYFSGNGKVEGSVPFDVSRPSSADMPTQLLLGSAGALVSGAEPGGPSLLIGLGSGVTLGAMTSRAGSVGSGRIDVVEIEESFLEALRRPEVAPLVRPWVDVAELRRPVRWFFGDARRVLARDLEHERYRVVVSQPSEPWIAGAAPLFTAEFFAEAAERLAPGGVLVQWVQLYRIDLESLTLLARTFQRVLPEVYVFRPPGTGELVLLGSEVRLPLARLAGAPGAPGIAGEAGWLALYLLGPEGVRDWVGRDPALPVNTDARGELEFRAPRTLHLGAGQARANLAALRARGGRDPVSRYLPAGLLAGPLRRELVRANIVLGDLEEAAALLDGDSSEEARALREEIALARRGRAGEARR